MTEQMIFWTNGNFSTANGVSPLLPVNTDFGQEVYVMIFHALKEAEKKRIAGKKKEAKHET